MNRIDSYNIYSQDSFMGGSKKTANDRKTGRTASPAGDKGNVNGSRKAGSTEKTGAGVMGTLSAGAKNLLEELKKKYSNMDFIVADYSTDEEANELLSHGTKEFSVLLDPETLEAMAADEDVKEQYIGILEDSTAKLTDMKEQLGEEGNQVRSLGMSIDKDGNVSFFAELEKLNENHKAWLDENREARARERKEAADRAGKPGDKDSKPGNKTAADAEDETKPGAMKRGMDRIQSDVRGQKQTRTAFVTGSTVEELMDKIKSFDWESVKPQEAARVGAKVDFTA